MNYQQMKKKITLRDIAKLADVSPATASIVLNEKKNQGISQKTWDRVKKIAKKNNYVGNNKIRRLNKRKFLFFMEEFSYNNSVVSSEFLNGFHDYDLLSHQFVFLFNQLSKKNNIFKIIEEFNPDGFIVATSYTKKINYDFNKIKLNKILLNCWNDNFKGISILPDDYNGSKNAVLHLLDHGYKNIAIILAPDFWMKGYRDRLNGWRDAHSDLNIEIDQKLIFKSEKSEIGNESRVGYNATKKLLKISKSLDAIFCTNDLIAMGTYQALKEEKLEIPKDIAVIGYDNSNIAENLKPELTSVQLPHAEMTQKSISHILNDNILMDNFKIYVDSPLISRSSVLIKK